jgi:hypothetical protein
MIVMGEHSVSSDNFKTLALTGAFRCGIPVPIKTKMNMSTPRPMTTRDKPRTVSFDGCFLSDTSYLELENLTSHKALFLIKK